MYFSTFHRAIILLTACLSFAAATARADIYQWEYVNSTDPSQGKQPSATLAPGGAGVDAVPGSSLSFLNLTMAYLEGADLSYASLFATNLTDADLDHATLGPLNGPQAIFTNADLNHANLSGAFLNGATLTGADFSGALVADADFSRNSVGDAGGITATQLYSTASYQSHNLSGIGLSGTNLANFDFSQQNLNNASFFQAELPGAKFNQANLGGASFYHASIDGADFTGATVNGANFDRDNQQGIGGLTVVQLQSTASYQSHDLDGISLWYNNLAGTDLSGQNLTSAGLVGAVLSGGTLAKANLSNANLDHAALDGVDLTDAEVRYASFARDPIALIGGLTPSQLSSTASYKAHDLTGISLAGNDLTGLSFAGQNLTTAYFFGTLLSGSDFTGANISLADLDSAIGFTKEQLYSTLNYQMHDLHAISMSSLHFAGADFSNQNLNGATLSFTDMSGASFHHASLSSAIASGALLSNANLSQADLSGGYFYGADFTHADLSGAIITFATFNQDSSGVGGLTLAQIYSTASYAAHDLRGIGLSGSALNVAAFADQNMPRANFSNALLNGADLSRANLAKAVFSGASLTGANFTAADTRGAYGLDLTGTIAVNTIRPDGHIAGLNLAAGQSLVVRNSHPGPEPLFAWPINGPPYPLDYFPAASIVVDQHFSMGDGGRLQLIFEDQSWGWNSSIAFAANIPVSLGGTLDLEFADGVDVGAQVGHTFDIFDWTGVNPSGAFTIDSPYQWDLSHLYTSGEITLVAVPEPASITLLLLAAVPITLKCMWRLQPACQFSAAC